MLGLLASRKQAPTASPPSLPGDGDEVAALIIPPQTYGPDWSFVRFERYVAHLLEIKDLLLIGIIATLPHVRHSTLPLQAAKPLAAIQHDVSNAAAIILAPRDQATRVAFVTLSDKAIPYVNASDVDEPGDTIPQGFDGHGEPVILPARHVERREGANPQFKLYDLRVVGPSSNEARGDDEN